MPRTGDLPEGFVVDEAPAPGGEGEDLTLEGILRDAGLDPAVVLQPPPQSAHEAAVAGFIDRVPRVSGSGRLTLEVNDPFAQVVNWVRQIAGREIGPIATWVRFQRLDLHQGALFVVSSPSPCGEVDLLVLAGPGMLTRGLIVDAAKWLFLGLGVSRVVCRIPIERSDLADYLLRAGFAHEGTSHGYFHGQADASAWSMTARSCRWLSHRVRPGPQFPAIPFLSLKVH